MNTLAINRPSRPGATLRQLALQPVDAWTRRRTLLTGLILAVVVAASGVQCVRSYDLSGAQSSHAALADLQGRFEQARATVDTLPSRRARQAPLNARWSTADALHDISERAARSGLRVSAIEPARSVGAAVEGQRVLRLRADASFSQICGFLESIGSLPRLVALDGVQIKRTTNALALEATLRVHENLPAVGAPAVQQAAADGDDPFGTQNAAAAGEAPPLLLVGTFVRPRRAIALVQMQTSVEGFEPGQMIGGERLGHVRPRSIDLGQAGGTARTVAFEEDRS